MHFLKTSNDMFFSNWNKEETFETLSMNKFFHKLDNNG